MNPSLRRAFGWAVLITATLVVVGVVAQVYLIAAHFGGAGDALDAHETVGGLVHGVEALVFLAAIGAYWKRWWDIGLAFGLIVIGTVQIGFVDSGEPWVGGLHGLFAVVVLVLATIIAHRAVRALGMGRHGGAAGAP
jgi:hypothetical protein